MQKIHSIEVKNINRRVGQLTKGADIVPLCAEDGTGVATLIELVCSSYGWANYCNK